MMVIRIKASLEKKEVNTCRDLNFSQRELNNQNEAIKVKAIKARNMGPIELRAKECTEDNKPDRVKMSQRSPGYRSR